jgi:hypothetical protein
VEIQRKLNSVTGDLHSNISSIGIRALELGDIRDLEIQPDTDSLRSGVLIASGAVWIQSVDINLLLN